MEPDTIYLISASSVLVAWALTVIIYVNCCRAVRLEPTLQPPIHDWVTNLPNHY